MRTKTLDCVEMKRAAQESIAAEWEARKQDFGSYGEFLEITLRESEWGRRMLQRFRPKSQSRQDRS